VIVAANDQMGIAAMRLLQDRGVAVPEQVMICGFNGFEFSQYSNPMLTTVRSPAYGIGARGGYEMVSRLEDGSFASEIITLPISVQPGGSTRKK
jgi:LacI family transcriptional regulator